MGIVVLKDVFILIKAVYKLIIKLTLIVLRKSYFKTQNHIDSFSEKN